MRHKGSCHCNAVQFEVEAPENVTAYECNCSICYQTGFLHLITPRLNFELLSGEEAITTYTFNSKIAKHTFCKICGVKAFYVPRSNPDGYSVNVRCLDQTSFQKIEIEPFDGRNWEKNASKIAHLS